MPRNTSNSRLCCILCSHGDEKAQHFPLGSKTFSTTQTRTTRFLSVHCDNTVSRNCDTIRRGKPAPPSGPSRQATTGTSPEARPTLPTLCVGNILDDFEEGKVMEVVGETHGTMHVRVSDFPHQSLHPQPASPFILPDEMECWPIAMPPQGIAVLFVYHESELMSTNAAWRLLIAQGTAVASTQGIMPQDVILGKILVSLASYCAPPNVNGSDAIAVC